MTDSLGHPLGCEKYEELITGAVDSELTAEEQQFLQEHMKTCENCRAAYETELWFKGFVREKLAGHPVPADLVRSIETGITKGAGSVGFIERIKQVLSVPLVRPAIGLGLVVLIALFFLRGRESQPDVVEQSFAQYDKALAGPFPLQLASGEPAVLRQFFAEKTDFPVLIPLMMDCTILGAVIDDYPEGMVAELVYQKMTMKIYLYQTAWEDVENGNGPTLTDEVKDELRRTNLYSRTEPDGRTIVLWKKGPTLASAVSHMTKADLIMCLTSGDPKLLEE